MRKEVKSVESTPYLVPQKPVPIQKAHSKSFQIALLRYQWLCNSYFYQTIFMGDYTQNATKLVLQVGRPA